MSEVKLDNIHDIKAAMRARIQEKYQKRLHATGRYKEELERRAEELAYEKKLADVGAVGVIEADQEALQASLEYEARMREIDQYNPEHEEGQKLAKEILGSGANKIEEKKVLQGMASSATSGRITAAKKDLKEVAKSKLVASKNPEEVFPDEP